MDDWFWPKENMTIIEEDKRSFVLFNQHGDPLIRESIKMGFDLTAPDQSAKPRKRPQQNKTR